MLIPLRHENMRGRRWPIVTFALISLNVVIFALTHWTMEAQQAQRAEVRFHLILLAGTHPELKPLPEAAEFINSIKSQFGSTWDQLSSPNRPSEDPWDAQMRQQDDPEQLQQEMDTLSQQFEELQSASISEHYGFVPAHPRAISYLTANFLHGGWLHLIGNMWFLWLAGFILEDNWGRVIYSVFYLLAGVASMQFYAWCAQGSFIPLVGASGAVAALMGAFLIRFPKMKIEIAFYFTMFYPLKFKLPAYYLLPFWALLEFFYGAALGQGSPVAHWAHVGGFLFGILGAYVIKKTGWEQQASAEIESKIAWASDPEVVRAQDALDQGKLDEAAAILEKHVTDKAASTDALIILQQVQWRRKDTAAYFRAMAQLIQAHLKARNLDAAWQAYEEFSNAGGDNLPAAPWLELIRHAESLQDFERAVNECDRLTQTHPQDKASLLALLTAGRLSLKKLNRPEEALRFYKAADASPVPHLDWDANIKAGIADAERALATAPAC